MLVVVLPVLVKAKLLGATGVHWAYNVVDALGVYDALASPALVPPLEAVYQPFNVYPLLVAVGKVIEPFVVDDVYWAYNVAPASAVYEPPEL